MEKQLALGWSFLGAGKAIANITTSLMNETARVDIKPTVLWGVVVYTQASDLLFDPEETRPQDIWENVTSGSGKTKIVKAEECSWGN